MAADYCFSCDGGSDVFVVRLQPEGDAVAFSVLLGGSGYESGYGLDVDGAGNLYVTGYTSSADDFPLQQMTFR